MCTVEKWNYFEQWNKTCCVRPLGYNSKMVRVEMKVKNIIAKSQFSSKELHLAWLEQKTDLSMAKTKQQQQKIYLWFISFHQFDAILHLSWMNYFWTRAMGNSLTKVRSSQINVMRRKLIGWVCVCVYVCALCVFSFSIFPSPFVSLVTVNSKINGNAWVETKLLLIIFRSCCHFRLGSICSSWGWFLLHWKSCDRLCYFSAPAVFRFQAMS